MNLVSLLIIKYLILIGYVFSPVTYSDEGMFMLDLVHTGHEYDGNFYEDRKSNNIIASSTKSDGEIQTARMSNYGCFAFKITNNTDVPAIAFIQTGDMYRGNRIINPKESTFFDRPNDKENRLIVVDETQTSKHQGRIPANFSSSSQLLLVIIIGLPINLFNKIQFSTPSSPLYSSTTLDSSKPHNKKKKECGVSKIASDRSQPFTKATLGTSRSPSKVNLVRLDELIKDISSYNALAHHKEVHSFGFEVSTTDNFHHKGKQANANLLPASTKVEIFNMLSELSSKKQPPNFSIKDKFEKYDFNM